MAILLIPGGKANRAQIAAAQGRLYPESLNCQENARQSLVP
jgi:hypothetical protein